MKFLQVNYECEYASTDPGHRERNESAAHNIKNVPGLLWKIWGYDDAAGQAAGLYLFADTASAEAWGEGPMRGSLGAMPGVSGITVRYFDVEESLSAITRGPLTGHGAMDR